MIVLCHFVSFEQDLDLHCKTENILAWSEWPAVLQGRSRQHTVEAKAEAERS